MKENINFYKPEEIKGLYPEITRVYQEAFGGEPWFEVSKCADSNDIKRCVGGFSKLTIGSTCELCLNKTEQPAYDLEELTSKFEALASTRRTAWYIEEGNAGVRLAALAWYAWPKTIFTEKYSDVPEMKDWLNKKLNYSSTVWLDEVFADKSKQPERNLNNFKSIVEGFSKKLSIGTLAFRTINPRMLRAAKRDFERSKIFERGKDVPDRRDFVVIDLSRGGCGR